MSFNMIRLSEIDDNVFQQYVYLAYKKTSKLRLEYPEYREWYFNKVVPGLNALERDIILVLNECEILGVSIIKDSNEKKICTFRIDEKYQRQGIGKLLFEKSFEILNCEKPIITIPGARVNEFNRIFKYFNFKLEGKYVNYYRHNSFELAYNGILDTEIIINSNILIA